MMVRLLLILLITLCAGNPAVEGDDPIQKLQVLIARLRDHRVQLAGQTIADAKGLLADARLLWSIDESRAKDAALVMLDVAGLYIDATTDPKNATPEAELRDAALATIEAHFEGAFGRWLVAEVFALPQSQPVVRRLAVARILETRNVPSAKLALLSATLESDPRIVRASRRALVGWSDDAVHGYFIGLLDRAVAKRDPSGAWLAEKHFSSVHFDEKSRMSTQYTLLVRTDLVSDDWRVASRAIALQAPISNEIAVPALIEALSTWKARAANGAQSLRVRFELQRALRARSGRAFGVEPEEWRVWWAYMRSGARGVAPQTGVPQEKTEASFFGIRPASDRVVFVIDRSGSMNYALGEVTGPRGEVGRKRWVEAQRQLFDFLDSIGPKAKFDVVLFHSIPEVWRGELVVADKRNLDGLKEWLKFQTPNGGTQLRAGVETAVHVGADGRVDLSQLEADTAIVLCDGETEEGAEWVNPFLERFLPETRLVFHGVQLGNKGDETLARLAKGSRGDFVKIDG
ncbi:MAG: hypothetical protein SGI72_06490 [Planctomycetota bacterium]|nr:hypothetical protein [Planctomycetota bacterium]